MTGSFLISYEDDIELGGDYLNIYSNGVIQRRIYNTVENLYSIPIFIGDVITIEYVPISAFTTNFDLIRRDYTTDDVNRDDGIKETIIASAQPLTTYTFTGSTLSNSYDFEYILSSGVQSNFQIWTEASEPILTENNEYINQEF